MTEYVIRFSSEYPKLHGQTSAELLTVRNLTIDEHTPEALVKYDTIKADGSRYPLPEGKYLQLIFLGNLRIPFCTIRKRTIDNVVRYCTAIGKMFDIVINGGKV